MFKISAFLRASSLNYSALEILSVLRKLSMSCLDMGVGSSPSNGITS